jgi:tetratricopeptide (TPR) repeat protein
VTDAQLASTHFNTLGRAYAAADPVVAEDAFRRALQLEPGVPAVHAALAEVLTRLNRYAEAASHLRRALTLDPQQEQALALQMDLLVAEGLVPEAIARFVTATANGASARIITSFGDLLARLGLREEAAARYREALRCGGTPEAHANLALLAVDEGRLDEALAGFNRALKLDPSSSEVRINRANVLVELGRLDEAVAEFTELTDDREVAGPAWWGLAAVNEARGDCAMAAAARHRAVQTDPELARHCATASVGA